MNLAFSALLIVVLALPGVILYYTYARGFPRWNSPISVRNVTDQIAYTVVAALALHLVWASFLSLFGVSFDIAAILRLLLDSYGPNDEYFVPTLQAIVCCPWRIALYLFSLYGIAAVIGYGTHGFVRWQKWDRTTRFFRFNNDWYYLLSGEVLEFAELAIEPRRVDGVYLSTIVQQGDNSYLYRGIVSDFFYGTNGQLDRVVLRFAHRRLLNEDRQPGQARDPQDPGFSADPRYYDIEGDYFILNAADMKTINLEYLTITTPQEDAEAEVPVVMIAAEEPSDVSGNETR